MSKNALSTALSLMLESEDKIDNREAIINYLITDPGTVQLSEKQQKLLERWEFADKQMRSRKYRKPELLNILMKRFDIQRATANRDISDAQYVFSSVNKPNKNYLLAIHVDRIEDACVWAQQEGHFKLIPFLFAELTRAIKELPAEEQGNPTPAAIVFNIGAVNLGALTKEPMTDAEAFEIAKKRLEQKGVDTIDLNPDDYKVT